MKVYLTDSLDGRLPHLALPAAITLRQVGLNQVRKSVDRGAHGMFEDPEMAASVMEALSRRFAQTHRQVNIAHGDQLFLAQQVDVSEGVSLGLGFIFYGVRIAR